MIKEALTFALAIAIALTAAADPYPELRLAAPGNVLRIAVTGDAGHGTAAVARGIATIDPEPDAILLTGDNFYPCGVRSATDRRWRIMDPLSSLGIPIYAVLGNHDHCSNEGAQINASQPNWNLPAREYIVRSPVADFAFLDTTIAAEGNIAPTLRLIESTFAKSKAPWRIAVGHHLIYSSGAHGLWPRDHLRNMRRVLPAMKESRVDLYICGHDHHVELLDAGLLILVSGAGSDPIPMIRVLDGTIWPRATRFRERISFAIVEITRESLRVRFHDSTGKAMSRWFERKR